MVDAPGKQVYLIGPNQLQNELLAYFLVNKLGVNCDLAASLSCVPPQDAGIRQKRVVLYDFSNAGQTLEELLESDTGNILKTDYLVLINLSHALNIEIEALQCGVRGFLYYQGGLEVLVKMMEAVMNSEFWISQQVISELILSDRPKPKPKPAGNPAGLSLREVDILRGIANGHTNIVIADTHCLSPHTVKTHIHHIYRKLNISNRLQAASWASEYLGDPP